MHRSTPSGKKNKFFTLPLRLIFCRFCCALAAALLRRPQHQQPLRDFAIVLSGKSIQQIGWQIGALTYSADHALLEGYLGCLAIANQNPCSCFRFQWKPTCGGIQTSRRNVRFLEHKSAWLPCRNASLPCCAHFTRTI